ncbi:MAG TPA: DoxX family protein [Terracidiphilus sp.]|nr:DoxX family protein [Terracidiphilus sp.]
MRWLTIPAALLYADWALLFLRLLVALVFGTSGFNHLKSPRARAESLGLSLGFTIFLGAAELAGAVALAVGFLAQWAALGLIAVGLGAIYMKMAKWKTGFWGEKASGWHYDLLFIAMNLVILCSGGGRIALMPL